MSEKYYITTPIYYVNDKPHIGHAYTTLACDVMARFKRLDGYEVTFLTGTDEHGQKVEKAAEAADLTPQHFTDQVSQNFRDLTKAMDFSNDDFIRTTEERHKAACQRIWDILRDNGNIKLGKYEAGILFAMKHFLLRPSLWMAWHQPGRLLNGLRNHHIFQPFGLAGQAIGVL